MSEFTEKDLQELQELENKDSIILLREVKALRAEVRELKAGRKEKSADKKKAEILSIKDTSKRLKAISENIDLFR